MSDSHTREPGKPTPEKGDGSASLCQLIHQRQPGAGATQGCTPGFSCCLTGQRGEGGAGPQAGASFLEFHTISVLPWEQGCQVRVTLPQEFLPEPVLGSGANSQVQLVVMACVRLPIPWHSFTATSPSPSIPQRTLGTRWAEQNPPRRMGGPTNLLSLENQLLRAESALRWGGENHQFLFPNLSRATLGFPQHPGACPPGARAGRGQSRGQQP